MNIFILDLNYEWNARFYVDTHIVKMPTEFAQILSTTCRLSGIDEGYKATHINHPCCIWARQSLTNWEWLRHLTFFLNQEWRYRYNHNFDHKSWTVAKNLPRPNIEDIGLTPFPLAISVDCKISLDPVKCYRKYYNLYKNHLFRWTKRPIPYWVKTAKRGD